MLTKIDIEHYFIAEKSESLLFIIIGAAAIQLALVFFFYLKTKWYKGAAIPLLTVGLMHCVAGAVIYARSDQDRIRNLYAYDMNPGELQTMNCPGWKK